MKKGKGFAVFFLVILFLYGCTGVPSVEVLLEKYPHSTEFPIEAPTLKIYFPSFTDDSWSEENNRVIGGDGSVIILPDDQVMIVDGFYNEASEDYIDFIKSLGIKHIDYLVLTHFHSDHSGTLPELIEMFDIDVIYTNGAYTDTAPTRRLLECIKENDVTEIVIKEGDIFSVGDCTITVYSPDLSEKDLYNVYHNPGKTAKMINDTSLVFKLEYDTFSVLFAGDVYKDRDRQITEKYGEELKSTILKLPHHGEFYTANSLSFAETVQPEYGIVMDNRYVSTMGSIVSNRYALSGGKVLYRNSAGFIFLESDGTSYSISEKDF
ncbi:MAG: MBL fold metallo-hydrolase [Treponema sp.]|nr:MBL fold metallo-hydrolase [Candidatus Treponema caballi]